MKLRTILFAASVLSLFAVAAVAQPGPGGKGPGKPPKEAVEACVEKSAGDECSFTGRNGETVTGECFSPESDKPLACRPDNPPPPPQSGNSR